MTPENKLKSNQQFDDKSLSFLSSLLLGDGSLSSSGRMVIAHGNSQKDYCEWKAKKISELLNQDIKALPTRQCTQIQFQRKFLRNKRYLWYPNNTKSIINILNDVTRDCLQAIAIWLCDDGNVSPSISDKGACYSAQIKLFTFTNLEESLIIIDWFEKITGIRPNVHFLDRSKSNKKSAYIIKFSSENSRKLFKLIKEYIPNVQSMNYKFRYLFADKRI